MTRVGGGDVIARSSQVIGHSHTALAEREEHVKFIAPVQLLIESFGGESL